MESSSFDEPDDGRSGRYTFITPEECRSEKVHRLIDYWDGLRGDRLMPRRRDIDPTDIWPLLKNIMVTEWHRNPDRLLYRIGGTEVVATLGKELGGKWLTELYPDSQTVERSLSLYRQVVETRKPVLGRTEGSLVRVGVNSYEWVICPLSEDGQQVTHFIGLEDYVAPRRYLGGGI